MTCPVDHRPEDPVPFLSGNNLHFKAHDVGWIISGFFTLIASVASFWLIFKHLTYYTCPLQQRHIVRMLFMVPIYAVVSWMSYLFYREAIYYETIRDCYEAVVITSFFYLLLQYVGDTRAEQHQVFRQVKLKKWFFPLGFWKYRPTGLHFLWLMKICILQYAIVRPVCTIAAVIMQYFGIYCLDSWAPYFGHIWISVAISISVTVAMYCIIQFYLPIEKELKPYSPVLKFLAVKSVVFLTFWQDSFLSILVFFKVIKATDYMTSDEIQAGINALLETFEMVIFAFLHIKAFTYLIYRPKDHSRTTSRWKAFVDVIDFRDWARQMKESSRYVYDKSRGREMTVVEDIRAEKYRHLAEALGKDRAEALRMEVDAEKDATKVPVPWKHPHSAGTGSPTTADPELGISEGTDPVSPGSKVVSLPRSQLIGTKAEDSLENGDAHRLPRGRLEEHDSLLATPREAEPRVPTLDYSRGVQAKPDRHPELSQYHSAPMQDHDDDCEADAEEVPPSEMAGHPREKSLGAWWRHLRERLSGSHYEDAAEEVREEEDGSEMAETKAWGEGQVTLLPLDVEIARHFTSPRRSTGDSHNGSRGGSDSARESVLKERPSPLSEIIASTPHEDEWKGNQGGQQSVLSRPRLVSSTSSQRFPEFQKQVIKRNTDPLIASPLKHSYQDLADEGSTTQKAMPKGDSAPPAAVSIKAVIAAQRLAVISGRTSGPNSEQASVSGMTGSASGGLPSRHPSSSNVAHRAHGAQPQVRREVGQEKPARTPKQGAALVSHPGPSAPPNYQASTVLMQPALQQQPHRAPLPLPPMPHQQHQQHHHHRQHQEQQQREAEKSGPPQQQDRRPRPPPQPAVSFAPMMHPSERVQADQVPGEQQRPQQRQQQSDEQASKAPLRSSSSFVTAASGVTDETSTTTTTMAPKKRLSAAGPKGKAIEIKVPSPLSPARFPYGQEGTLPEAVPKPQTRERASSGSRAETDASHARTSSSSLGRGSRRHSALTFETPPAASVRPTTKDKVVSSAPSAASSGARILSGPMSLKQAREAEEAAQAKAREEAEARAEAQETRKGDDTTERQASASPISPSKQGGLFRLPGRRRPSADGDIETPLPAPSQMSPMDGQVGYVYAQSSKQTVPPQDKAARHGQRPGSDIRQPRQHAAFPPPSTSSSFAVGQIVTPAQRMMAGYAPQVRPPPRPQFQQQSRRSSYQQQGQYYAAPPSRPPPRPRYSMPAPSAVPSVNLRGDTSYDRWTGEPMGHHRPRAGGPVPRRESMPAPGVGQYGGGSNPQRYDSSYHIEYID